MNFDIISILLIILGAALVINSIISITKNKEDKENTKINLVFLIIGLVLLVSGIIKIILS